jgi:NAD(P)-dependent dehydrogenase (short-subunit alcohol dehydrogenase family)
MLRRTVLMIVEWARMWALGLSLKWRGAGQVGNPAEVAFESGLMGSKSRTPIGISMLAFSSMLLFLFHPGACVQVGNPAEVAKAVLFLASPASSFTTGELLRVDGGMNLSSWFNLPAYLAMYVGSGSQGGSS